MWIIFRGFVDCGGERGFSRGEAINFIYFFVNMIKKFFVL